MACILGGFIGGLRGLVKGRSLKSMIIFGYKVKNNVKVGFPSLTSLYVIILSFGFQSFGYEREKNPIH